MLRMFKSVVVWGLRSDTDSTHRYIHHHLFTVLTKLGIDVIWCNNIIENNDLIKPGSLVISYNLACANIKYDRKNYYAVLNMPLGKSANPEAANYLHMRVYGEVPLEPDSDLWNSSTAFSKRERLLYQTWATDILPDEFLPPVFSTSNIIHWIGSIWNDNNNDGNIENIKKLQQSAVKHQLKFIQHSNVNDETHVDFIRKSRIAPAIGGNSQVVRNMIPCRLWKNISYGQLGVTNLPKSVDIFGNTIVFNINIDALIDTALSIPEKQYISMIFAQQELVSADHTYLNWLYNIARAFGELTSA